MDWKQFFVLILSLIFDRLFSERKHTANSKHIIFNSPSSHSYIVLALKQKQTRINYSKLPILQDSNERNGFMDLVEKLH